MISNTTWMRTSISAWVVRLKFLPVTLCLEAESTDSNPVPADRDPVPPPACISENWDNGDGSEGFVGINELQFFAVPEPEKEGTGQPGISTLDNEGEGVGAARNQRRVDTPVKGGQTRAVAQSQAKEVVVGQGFRARQGRVGGDIHQAE